MDYTNLTTELKHSCLFNNAHCFHQWSANAISAYIYTVAFVISFVVSVSRSRLKEHGHATLLLPARRIKWFPTLITISFALRAFWLVLKDMNAFKYIGPDGNYTHIEVPVPLFKNEKIDLYPVGVSLSGKLATLLYFSAFTIIVRFWDDILKNTPGVDQPLAHFTQKSDLHRATNKSRTIFVIVNLWMYVAEFGIICAKTFFPKFGQRRQWILDVDYVVVALFFLALSIAMGSFGYQLQLVFQKIEFSTAAKSIQRRICAISIICSLLFLLRAILFMYSPAAKKLNPGGSVHIESTLGKIVYPWYIFAISYLVDLSIACSNKLYTLIRLFYTVPEVLPAMTVLSMMAVKRRERHLSPEFQPLLHDHSLPRVPSAFSAELSI